MTRNRRNIEDTVKSQILDQFSYNTKLHKQIQKYPEFTVYHEKMVQINIIFNKIINLFRYFNLPLCFFRMAEYYLNVKASSSKSRQKMKSAPWDVNLMIKRLGLKTLSFFMYSTDNLMKMAFSHNKSWRPLLTMGLITVLRANPAAFAAGLTLNSSSVWLPVVVRKFVDNFSREN